MVPTVKLVGFGQKSVTGWSLRMMRISVILNRKSPEKMQISLDLGTYSLFLVFYSEELQLPSIDVLMAVL